MKVSSCKVRKLSNEYLVVWIICDFEPPWPHCLNKRYMCSDQLCRVENVRVSDKA